MMCVAREGESDSAQSSDPVLTSSDHLLTSSDPVLTCPSLEELPAQELEYPEIGELIELEHCSNVNSEMGELLEQCPGVTSSEDPKESFLEQSDSGFASPNSETRSLNGEETHGSGTKFSGTKIKTEEPGYSVDVPQPDISEISFQELLNEAHEAVAAGTMENVVDNILDSHVRTGPLPSPMVPTVYCCELCGKTFTQMWILNRHYNSSHGFSKDMPKACKTCGKTVSPNEKHYCFQCPHCVLKCVSKNALREHVLTQHTQSKKKCEVCGAEFASQQTFLRHSIECKVSQGPQQDNKESFHCKMCNEVLVSFQQLKKHELNYNSLSHKCPVCEKLSFCNFKALFSHVWTKHHKKNSGGAEYTCPVCEEVFKNYRGYAYHVYDVHEGHTEQEVLDRQEDTRYRKRSYMYSYENYRNKKLCVEKETLHWEFEGEFQAGEEPELEDFARCSTRLEMLQKKGGNPTMVGKRNVEFISLPPKRFYRKKTVKNSGGSENNGEVSRVKKAKANIEKRKKSGKTSAKTKAKRKNIALNKS